MRKRPAIPPLEELGTIAVDQLERGGGWLSVPTLRDRVRDVVVRGARTSSSWDREFGNAFRWTMFLLAELAEVRFDPPFSLDPDGGYELLARDRAVDEPTRQRARRDWVEAYLATVEPGRRND